MKKTNYLIEDKVPPQALDLEQSILSALITSTTLQPEIFELLFADVFYREENKMIFEAAEYLYTHNTGIDVLTIKNRLKETEKLELIGGEFYLNELRNKSFNFQSNEFSCRILLQKYLQREIIRIAYEKSSLAFEDTIDVFELHEQNQLELEKSLQAILKGKTASGIETLTEDAIVRYNARKQAARENKITGINTGLTDLNKITGGWQKSDLIILAGRPSQGKTAVALNFVFSSDKKWLVFSLEMGEGQLTDRLMVAAADVDAGKYRDGYLSNEEEYRLYSAKAILDKKGDRKSTRLNSSH